MPTAAPAARVRLQKKGDCHDPRDQPGRTRRRAHPPGDRGGAFPPPRALQAHLRPTVAGLYRLPQAHLLPRRAQETDGHGGRDDRARRRLRIARRGGGRRDGRHPYRRLAVGPHGPAYAVRAQEA